MLKKISCLFLFFLLASCGSKLIKTKSFKFNYTVPPLIKMYAEAESIGFNCLTKDAIWCRDKIRKHLSTEYEVNKFNSNGTDLSFRISTFVNVITPIKTDTKTSQRTDKDGNPYTVTTITKRAKYRFSIRLELVDKNGSLLRISQKNTEKEIKESASSHDAATRDFNRAFQKEKKKSYESMTYTAYHELENEFLKENRIIYTSPLSAKSKKHDYNDLNSAANSQVEWMTLLINKQESFSNPTIKELIEVYEEILAEMNTHSSKARVNKKIGAACYHNLSLLYLSANQKQKALDYMIKSREIRSINSTQSTIISDFNKIKNRTGF